MLMVCQTKSQLRRHSLLVLCVSERFLVALQRRLIRSRDANKVSRVSFRLGKVLFATLAWNQMQIA
jgi:hypothetical protein